MQTWLLVHAGKDPAKTRKNEGFGLDFLGEKTRASILTNKDVERAPSSHELTVKNPADAFCRAPHDIAALTLMEDAVLAVACSVCATDLPQWSPQSLEHTVINS